MRVRLTSIAALLSAAIIATLMMSGNAQAAAPTCEQPPPRDDNTIHVIGCLRDTRDDPASPVPGVSISVEDESGNVVGTTQSNETGIFDIPLPGSAIDNLGKTYVIKIDESTLPEGTKLTDPDKVTLKQRITLDSDVSITFPIGDKPEGTSKFVQGLQLFVGSIVFCLLLAMAALGLSMIFGTTGLVNFAHGELITFGALVAFGVDQLPGDITVAGTDVTVVVAIVVAFLASGLFGWAMNRGLWAPLRNRGTGLIAMMIVSIGLSIFLRNLYQYLAGANTRLYSQYSSPTPWEVGAITITPRDVYVSILAAVVLVVVTLALQRTRIGKATRAVADNPALAASSGINVERVIAVVWIGGAALAGLAGVLLGVTQGFDYQVGFKMLLLVFAAVTLGGLGTIWGAIAGSFIIGIFIDVSTLVVAPELKEVGALVILIGVLLVRPQGLLGRAGRVG